jgi:dihydroorotate dehydrogenase electron transfer subunit
MLQIRAKILYNKRVKDNYFHLVLEAPQINKKSLPGQFLNIKVNDAYEPLLRRPFSIHKTKGATQEILYAVVGRGTETLSHKRAGEYLDVIGPLGSGFDCKLQIANRKWSILVGGGIGVAPLIFLAEELARSKSKNKKSKIIVLIGAETKNHILCEKEFKQLGCEVKIASDDGSRGFKGKVTELLKNILPLAISHKPLAIYACGPRPMLKEISQISKKYKIPAQVSLEEHMACGIGVCLGCAVNTKEGFKRVCKEGPVFNADEISWK